MGVGGRRQVFGLFRFVVLVCFGEMFVDSKNGEKVANANVHLVHEWKNGKNNRKIEGLEK